MKALGAFIVMLAGVGMAHAQDLPSTPVGDAANLPIDFTARPAADPTVGPLAPPANTTDPFSPAVWRTSEVDFSAPTGPQQRLRLSVGEHYVSPDGLPVVRPDLAREADRSFAFNYSLGLPGALSFSTPDHDWNFTPHAAFGVTDQGGLASAGAVLSVSERAAQALEGLGVHDGAPMAARGRYYLFAAASGRAVGLNLLRDSSTGDWRRAGWTTDPSSSLVGEAQVGVGWRRGAMQTSLGYVHRDYDPTAASLFGLDGRNDDRVAFSFSLRPH